MEPKKVIEINGAKLPEQFIAEIVSYQEQNNNMLDCECEKIANLICKLVRIISELEPDVQKTIQETMENLSYYREFMQMLYTN